MVDGEYISSGELARAVQKGQVKCLDEQEVIGRLYTVDQIRTIAGCAGPDVEKAVRVGTGKKGILACYERAQKLVTTCLKQPGQQNNREALGIAVLEAEHKHAFGLLSYFGMPISLGANAEQFWSSFCSREKIADGRIAHFAQPFLQPGDLNPRLESAQLDGSRVTFVFAQLRVMRKGGSTTNDVASLFVARVPVLVSFLFDLEIIEISMPDFADVALQSITETCPQSFPARAFHAIRACRSLAETYSRSQFKLLPRDNLMIYLETEKSGEDLGWDVERLTGKKGQFNTTQRTRIPLKEILTDFTTELAKKCEKHGYVNPLENPNNPLESQNLYEIFRTLKAESHTISMDMGVPLGKNKGRVELTAYFGIDGDGNIPLYEVQGHLTPDARDKLRNAAKESSIKTDLKDPYAIATRFRKKGS